jgi:hypothetical protein
VSAKSQHECDLRSMTPPPPIQATEWTSEVEEGEVP